MTIETLKLCHGLVSQVQIQAGAPDALLAMQACSMALEELNAEIGKEEKKSEAKQK